MAHSGTFQSAGWFCEIWPGRAIVEIFQSSFGVGGAVTPQRVVARCTQTSPRQPCQLRHLIHQPLQSCEQSMPVAAHRRILGIDHHGVEERVDR